MSIRKIARASAVVLLVGGCGDQPQSSTSSASEQTTSGSETSSTSGDTTAGPTTTASESDPSTTEISGTGSESETTGGEPLKCNGHEELCDRPFNEVVFACTHNAHSATSEGYGLNANHKKGVSDQLKAGIRAMMLDVYIFNDETTLCHGPCGLGNQPHIEVVEILRNFLAENPGEILTIIYQDDVEPSAIEADFLQAGLAEYVYTHPDGEPWPTLGEMVAANTRLLVTAENGSPPPGWYHHAWDLIWDTPYSHMSPDDFSCELNRGKLDNDLFLINHWVNNLLDLPSEPDAQVVNQFDVLYGRAMDCLDQTGRLPNFIGIDFFQQGDLVEVVDALNGV